MHKETLIIEQFLHKHTGLEFGFAQDGRINGIQITNLKKYNKFIKENNNEL